MKQIHTKLLILFYIFFFSHSCKNEGKNDGKNKTESENIPTIDFKEIRERGKIIALTDYNSTSYFIYKGMPMGYQYELLQNFAKYMELDIEIIVNNNLEESFKALQNHTCDILAVSLTVTNERQKFFNFSDAIGETRQVLIQRKPKNWQVMAGYSIEKELIRNQLDLAGKTIHVMKNSAFATRLRNLQNEIGDSINIEESEDMEMEQLIELVAKGDIDYAVADEEVALVNQTYHPNIDVYTAISFPQKQAWAVNKNSPELLKKLNKWLGTIKGSSLHSVIYNKYFRNIKAKERNDSPFLSISGGKISIYDKIIKKYAKQIGWDWRLLASLIYQESRFNHDVESWAGAFGLMQLMPQTAQRFGANARSSIDTHIKAGTKFIKWLDNQLEEKVPDEEERIKFVLASYNVGLGHIYDAIRLADSYGKDTAVWTDNVDFFVLNKSNPKYYNNKCVKYGYCRGEDAFLYVKDVVKRYEIYKSFIK